jgi:hypothetical protein
VLEGQHDVSVQALLPAPVSPAVTPPSPPALPPVYFTVHA